MLNQQIPQVFTLILWLGSFSSEYIKRKTTDNLVIDGSLLVIRLGLEPKTPTLKVLSLKAFKSLRLRLDFQMQPAEQANLIH